jgi:hypothetical protein
MWAWVLSLFERDFLPHGHCFFWEPDILWMRLIGDGLTAAAYFAIPLLLEGVFRSQKERPFSALSRHFALFIGLCGMTHVMDIIVLWNPLYRIDAVIRIGTGMASVSTAYLLATIVPRMLVDARAIREENKRMATEITNLRASKGRLEDILKGGGDLVG